MTPDRPSLAAAEAERLTRDGTKTSKEQVATLLALGRLQVPSFLSVPWPNYSPFHAYCRRPQALSQNPAANKNEIEKIVAGV